MKSIYYIVSTDGRVVCCSLIEKLEQFGLLIKKLEQLTQEEKTSFQLIIESKLKEMTDLLDKMLNISANETRIMPEYGFNYPDIINKWPTTVGGFFERAHTIDLMVSKSSSSFTSEGGNKELNLSITK